MTLDPDHWDRYFVERDEDRIFERERDHVNERQRDLYDELIGRHHQPDPVMDVAVRLQRIARDRAAGAVDLNLWEQELADLEPLVELFPYPSAPEYMRREH